MRGWIGTGVAWAALAAASASAQPPARWVSIGTDPDSELFYDAASVVRRGGTVEYRLRAVMREERLGEMRSLAAHGQLDCAEQTIVYSAFQPFDAAGRPMARPEARTLPPEPIQPGGPQARLYQILCPGRLLRPLPAPPLMIVPWPRQPPPPMAPPTPPPRAPTRVRPAEWLTPPGSLVAANDYPAAAIRAGAAGRVEMRLFVSPAGRVQRCAVIVSSGSALLDETACRLLQERARFTPARNERGRRAVGTVTTAINWRLPD